MNRTNYIKSFFWVALTSLPLVLTADEIFVENDQGEGFILPVDRDDSFLDVMDSLHDFGSFDRAIEEEEFHSYKICVIPKNFSKLEKIFKKARLMARSYETGITPQEAAEISYIVKTLANSSLPKINAARNALEKAGDKIEHVHPFFFLSAIFTNEELKVCMRNLKGRLGAWDGFMSGVIRSMTEENARNNVLPYVNQFAALVKVDPNMILPAIQAGKWERLVITLIDIVPREGGADRYDM